MLLDAIRAIAAKYIRSQQYFRFFRSQKNAEAQTKRLRARKVLAAFGTQNYFWTSPTSLFIEYLVVKSNGGLQTLHWPQLELRKSPRRESRRGLWSCHEGAGN